MLLITIFFTLKISENGQEQTWLVPTINIHKVLSSNMIPRIIVNTFYHHNENKSPKTGQQPSPGTHKLNISH
jgi:hypothetical protein